MKFVLFFLSLLCISTEVIACVKPWHSPIKKISYEKMPKIPHQINGMNQREKLILDLEEYRDFIIEEYREDLETFRYHNENIRKMLDICLKEKKITQEIYSKKQIEYQEKIDLYFNGMAYYLKLFKSYKNRIEYLNNINIKYKR